MALTWHILKKDFRAERWLLVGWMLFSVIDAVNRVITPRLSMNGAVSATAASMWSMLLWLANSLFLLAFVAHHIQAETLVGTTAFWLTRPVPRGALFWSKLMGLLLFIIVPGLVVEAVLLVIFHVPPGTMLAALLQQALSTMLLMLVIAFAASITSSAMRLLQLVVGTLLAMFVVLLVAMLRMDVPDMSEIGPSGIPPDPTPDVIMVLALVIGFTSALWYHYASRRRTIAVLVFVGVFVAGNVIGAYWPHVSLFGGEPVLAESWAQDPSVSRLRLRSNERWYSQTYVSGLRGRPSDDQMVKYVVAPILLDGLPANYTASPFTREASLTLDDGRVIRSARSQAQAVRVSAAKGELLRGQDVFTVPSKFDNWATLMLVPVEAFDQDGRRPGRYRGTFEFIVTRHEPLTVLPLTNGASFVDGARSVTVAGTAYRANRCVVSLESSAADTFASQLSQPRLVPHFRLRDGVLLADRPDFQSSQSFGRAPVSMHAGGGGGIGSIYFGVGPVYLPQPLQITYFTLEPTFAVAIDLSRPVPPGPPCDHIELVLERTTYAGRLTRTLELADFRMDDQASAR